MPLVRVRGGRVEQLNIPATHGKRGSISQHHDAHAAILHRLGLND